MKRIFTAIFLLFTFTAPLVHADPEFGACNMGGQTVSSVVCYGPAVLRNTNVTGDVKIAGSLIASNMISGPMTIAGAVEMRHSTTKGAVDVTGMFNASDADFEKGIYVESNKVTLNNSAVDGAVKISSPKAVPVLRLKCGSIIAGSVTFDNTTGVVQMSRDSFIQGKVVNGKTEIVDTGC